MSASDHIHPAIRVFHASYEETPPHEREHEFFYRKEGNNHPDVVHAGTEQAAKDVARGVREYMHMYEITPGEEYPVTFGDEETETQTYESPVFTRRMRNVQPGLFETISGDPDLAIKSNRAVPYRNTAEDKGSISFMIPKGAIGKTVRYLGVQKMNANNGVEVD